MLIWRPHTGYLNYWEKYEDIDDKQHNCYFAARQSICLKKVKVITREGIGPGCGVHFSYPSALLPKLTRTLLFPQAIPIAVSGRDIIGVAKIGSGKTAAFLWPALFDIMNQPELEPLQENFASRSLLKRRGLEKCTASML